MRGIDICSCQTLRHLELSNAWFLGQWIEDVSSGFRPLKSLVLLRFRQMVVIRWCRHNQHLQLVFCGCDHGAGGCVVKAKINTPNLLSFVLNISRSNLRVFCDLLSNFSLNAPNLRGAAINFNFSFEEEDFY